MPSAKDAGVWKRAIQDGFEWFSLRAAISGRKEDADSMVSDMRYPVDVATSRAMSRAAYFAPLDAVKRIQALLEETPKKDDGGFVTALICALRRIPLESGTEEAGRVLEVIHEFVRDEMRVSKKRKGIEGALPRLPMSLLGNQPPGGHDKLRHALQQLSDTFQYQEKKVVAVS